MQECEPVICVFNRTFSSLSPLSLFPQNQVELLGMVTIVLDMLIGAGAPFCTLCGSPQTGGWADLGGPGTAQASLL